MGSIQLLRASTGEMLPRARRQIHPPQQQGGGRGGIQQCSDVTASLSGRKHSSFSFGNNFSCSTSLEVFFCSLSHAINFMSSESQTQLLPWSFSESLPGLSFL